MSTSRIDELKAQINQLDQLVASGTLSADAGREARARLEAEVVALVLQGAGPLAPSAPGPAVPAIPPTAGTSASPSRPVPSPAVAAMPPAGVDEGLPPARPSTRLIAALAGFVLVFSVAGYAVLGNRAGWSVEPGQGGGGAAAASAPITAEQIDAMVQRLADRLKQQPDDAEGWTMLGRSYSILGRFDEAVPAFQRLVALRPQDAQAHADLADAMGSAAGGNLQGEPARLIDKALQLDPRNLKALALAGSLAFNQGQAAEALRRWEAALALAEPGSEMAQQLQGVVEEARRRAAGGSTSPAAAGPVASASAAAPGSTPPATPAAAASAVQGRVTLAAGLRARVSPEDTLFVFARPAEGARMPLAILRKQVKDLPLDFLLDDSLAMSPAARLSGTGRVIVGARISKSGNAMPQPGDLQGLSAPVPVGSRGILLEISDVLP